MILRASTPPPGKRQHELLARRKTGTAAEREGEANEPDGDVDSSIVDDSARGDVPVEDVLPLWTHFDEERDERSEDDEDKEADQELEHPHRASDRAGRVCGAADPAKVSDNFMSARTATGGGGRTHIG